MTNLGLCPRPRDFLRHGSDVQRYEYDETRTPREQWTPGAPVPLAHPRHGYPLSVCFPAERDSVSPSEFHLRRLASCRQADSMAFFRCGEVYHARPSVVSADSRDCGSVASGERGIAVE